MTKQDDADDSVGAVNSGDESDDSKDIVWKLLCWNQWSIDMTNDMLRHSNLSPEVCFRTFVIPPRKDDGASPLLVLHYAPKDYVMIVTARKNSGDLLFCQSIPGEKLGSIFSKGEMEFELKQPIQNFVSLSDSHCSLEDLYDSFEYNDVSWIGKVQLLRCTDNKLITLLDRKYWCSLYLRETQEEEMSQGKLDVYKRSLGNMFPWPSPTFRTPRLQ